MRRRRKRKKEEEVQEDKEEEVVVSQDILRWSSQAKLHWREVNSDLSPCS